MIKNIQILIVLLLLSKSIAVAQNNDWIEPPYHFFEGKISKLDGSIRYTVDATMSIAERNDVVTKTKKYISQNLALLNESMFNDSIDIILVRDRNEMFQYSKRGIEGCVFIDDTSMRIFIICIYNPESNHLKHDLMDAMITCKWGSRKETDLGWLKEGLAMFSDPTSLICDGHTFKERYVYFQIMGNNLTAEELIKLPAREETSSFKVASNQTAYIAKYLLANYGVESIKQLWCSGMADFEKIFGIGFEKLISKINNELSLEYPNPINFNWSGFNRDCLDTKNRAWHSARIHNMDNKFVSKTVRNIKYTVDSTMTIPRREEMITDAERYIAECSELMNEPIFSDFLHIILVRDRNDMIEYMGGSIGGITNLKDEYNNENSVISVYGDQYSPLKHEIMHACCLFKWGDSMGLAQWLVEGLAVFANPEVYTCDNLNLEERYAYFMQNNKLLNIKDLYRFPASDDSNPQEGIINDKISYCQSGYIVNYLYDNYGVDKLKTLWLNEIKIHKENILNQTIQREKGSIQEQTGNDFFELDKWNNFLADFENVYQMSFDAMMEKINNELRIKYPHPIAMDWDLFSKSCIK